MLTSSSAIEEILALAPEWQPVLDSVKESLTASGKGKAESVKLSDLFERLGAKALYMKAGALSDKRPQFLLLLRDYYYQPMLSRMLVSNQHLRRFLAQRKQPLDFQKSQALSMAVELSVKLSAKLENFLNSQERGGDGFKVLLPAYAQRSVHNAVVDYIKEEWQWEKETLQDLNLDPEQEDPRQNVSDDAKYGPEARILSSEQVGQLNQLRAELEAMLKDKSLPQEPLVVVDCMFGLGLTPRSQLENELTMREVCDLLGIAGETQARKIARCQVLLDKGLDMIRSNVRRKLPGLAECWQTDINVNTASRRELSHQLSLTEGEVEKLIAGRQYYALDELIQAGVVKPHRIEEIAKNGAVASFVPVDLNACTTRDMIDILGLGKEVAQKLTQGRPFNDFAAAQKAGPMDAAALQKVIDRGAVLKRPAVNQSGRVDINHATSENLTALGLSIEIVKKIERGRPFSTWGELEEYLCPDDAQWQVLRQKSCLSIIPR